MALLVFTGAEMEALSTSANNNGRWLPQTGRAEFLSTGGRDGGKCLSADQSNYSALVIGSNPSTLVVSGAFKVDSSTGSALIRFKLGATDNVATLQFNPYIKNIQFYRGNSSVLLATSDPVDGIYAGRWVWVSIKVVWSTTVGSIVVNIDGVEALNETGLNTLGSLTAPNVVGFTSASTVDVYWDDLIINDTTGSAPFNDLLPDMAVRAVFPTSDGTVGWTRSTGTSGFALIDEPSLSTTDYVSGTATGTTDTYGMGDINTALDVLAAQATVAGMSTSGTSTVRLKMIQGIDAVEANVSFVNTTPSHKSFISELAPDGGEWTAAKLNSTIMAVLIPGDDEDMIGEVDVGFGHSVNLTVAESISLEGTTTHDLVASGDLDVETPVTDLTISYLVLAGGGGGGKASTNIMAGGGGAGGLVESSTILSPGSYAVTVGGGGAGASVGDSNGGTGGASAIAGVVSVSGGGGGSGSGAGVGGGSGGGGRGSGAGAGGGGAGTGGQGNNGGAGTASGAVGGLAGGGGGGKGGAGTADATGGDGGAGIASSISGVSVAYAGGGGGACGAAVGAGAGGSGIGGAGGSSADANGGTAVAGRGSGGGGGRHTGNGGAGSSGVVIIRYLGTPAATGGSISQSGGYTRHTFTSSGTFTVS